MMTVLEVFGFLVVFDFALVAVTFIADEIRYHRARRVARRYASMRADLRAALDRGGRR